VDLPQPEGPTKARKSPRSIRMLVGDKAVTAVSPVPKTTEASCNSSAGLGWTPAAFACGGSGAGMEADMFMPQH